MDTNRLKYFCTIAETGSLTKAGEILGVSHSGLSKAVSVLQSETGLQLFRPQGRGLEITQQGKWFYQKAIEILKIENQIVIGIAPPVQHVRLGLTEVLAVSCAGALAIELKESITIIETDVGEAENLILSGELDFGFTFTPAPRIELEYLDLGYVKFNGFAKANFIKNKTKEDLAYAIPATNLAFNPLGYKVRDGWPFEFQRKTKYHVSGFNIALNLLRAGESAVYMPDFVANLENENLTDKFQVIKVPFHLEAQSKRKLFLIKNKHIEESKEMKKVSKILRRICCQ
jgi:DNA-binding transcriptional LysR family regulator